MTDGVADLIIRIKNALGRKQEIVDAPHSILKEEVVKVLLNHGYLEKKEVLTRGGKKILRMTLKYKRDQYGKKAQGAILDLKRISRPGKRIYVDVRRIPRVQSGYGLAVLSTSRGVITDSEARQLKIGGEIICYVY